MGAVTFETFDPTPYQHVPRLAVEGALALARALLQRKPAGMAELDRMADRLQRLVGEVEATLAVRRREAMPTDYAMEVELDGVTDALWGALRSRLATWAAFAHPGLSDVVATLDHDSTTRATLTDAQHKASRARGLAGHLFGAEGLKFTQTTFAEQARTMAGILELVDQDELGKELDALVGPELLAGLRTCQKQYEAMVGGRESSSERRSADLAGLRGKLQRAIARYNGAVLLLLDEDDPASLARVLEALEPVDVARAESHPAGKGGE